MDGKDTIVAAIRGAAAEERRRDAACSPFRYSIHLVVSFSSKCTNHHYLFFVYLFYPTNMTFLSISSFLALATTLLFTFQDNRSTAFCPSPQQQRRHERQTSSKRHLVGASVVKRTSKVVFRHEIPNISYVSDALPP